MSFRQSIRWRIQAWHGTLLLAVVAGFCVTTYRLQWTNASRHLDSELQLRIGALTGTLGKNRPGQPPRPPEDPTMPGEPPADRPDDRPGSPPGNRPGPRGDIFQTAELLSLFNPDDPAPFYYSIWTRNGPLLTASPSAPDDLAPPARPPGEMPNRLRTRDDYREAITFTPPGECLLVGQSMVPLEREMRDFAWKLAAIGGGVFIFGLAGGWWMASRAIRPIAAITAAATRIADGNLSERIVSGETESELGRLATVLDQTFQKLHVAFDEQARFTSDAAHELRTPVSVILGQSQLALGRERSAADYRTTIETCQRAAQRMHSLIESLLQLSLLDSERQPLDRQPCDLADLGREQLDMIQPIAAEKNITVTSDLRTAPCLANADGISQIFTNLLTNAVKFCSEGDQIHLSTLSENGEAVLRVRDTGPGIAAGHLPHLFERFYRADASRNRSTGGAGLGLAICKSMAESHGGTLSVESRLGKGTCFTLLIPAQMARSD